MSLNTRRTMIGSLALLLAGCSPAAHSADLLKVTIPKHSHLTPVQRLNREGVKAVEKHHYERAGELFYKAYLFDPADPFTLNNLGYISELKGDWDQADSFYALAAKQKCTATIDRSNVRRLIGKPMLSVFESQQKVANQVNRMNVDAMDLLSRHRGFEAVALLRKTLALDVESPFTLNNLGVANEATGDYAMALTFYEKAADTHSLEPVVLTTDRAWRGKPVSAMAGASFNRLKRQMKSMNGSDISALMLTLQGVSATNRNNWPEARQDFLRAYSLNPTSAFSLNNRGYVAEMDGDLETAQVFYAKARSADGADGRIGSATEIVAEGMLLSNVAGANYFKVGNRLDNFTRDQHQRKGPIELTPRGYAPSNGLKSK